MGKRKSKARVLKKERPRLNTVFDCPCCNYKGTVECSFKADRAYIRCRVCDANYTVREKEREGARARARGPRAAAGRRGAERSRERKACASAIGGAARSRVR
jgi:hypothetical protein